MVLSVIGFVVLIACLKLLDETGRPFLCAAAYVAVEFVLGLFFQTAWLALLESSAVTLAYVAAYAVKNIMERKRVHIVSHTAYRSMFNEIGLSVHDDLQKTIDSLKAKDREIVVLENSYILPQVETTMEGKL